MPQDWEHFADKLLLVLIAVYFGWFAIHGNNFAQHVADGVVGGLLTLIVQRVTTNNSKLPPAPQG
jgi:hypothetical protein